MEDHRNEDRPDVEAGRGDQARTALLQAAIDVFGESSLEDATTREISRRSGQNIASIAYYFGNKEGLYHACVGHVVEMMRGLMGPMVAEIEEELAVGAISRARCLSRLQDMYELLAVNGFLRSETVSVSRIIMREMVRPTEAFEIFFNGPVTRFHELATELIRRYLGRETVDQDLVIFSHTLFGQVLGFRAAREFFLRRVEWMDFGPEESSAVISVLRQNIEILLAGWRGRERRASRSST
ncbi:MAG: transcriptional regulator CecR [Opitutaceae bacterium]